MIHIRSLKHLNFLIKLEFYLSLKWPVGKCVEFLFEKLKIKATKLSLHLDEKLVDNSLNVEEVVKNNSLNLGAVFELK